jgi:hypothetical protein
MKKLFAAFLTILLVCFVATFVYADTESLLSFINQKIIKCDTDDVTITGGTITATGIAQETTLQGLDAKVIAADTGNVTVASSALPTGAATEATLSTLNGKVTAVDTGNVTIGAALPAGANDIGDVTVNNVAGTNAVPIQGNTANGDASSGNPVALGILGIGTSPASLVDPGDVVRLSGGLSGQMSITECPPGTSVHHEVVRTATTASTELFTAVAGQRRYLRTLHIYNSSATPTRVIVRSGAADTLFGAPANFAHTVPIVPAWGGTAATNITVETTDSVSSVYIT